MQLKTNAEIAQTIFLIQIPNISTAKGRGSYFDVNICIVSYDEI